MIQRSLPGTGGLISLFTRHPNAANLVMILMIIFGIFGIVRINTQFFPTVNIPVITVAVSWPGASAEDVESNILQVMEPELRFLDGVKRVTSRASEGIASIGLEYETDYDLSEALREAEAAVKAITNLPEDAETPTVTQRAFFDRVARLALSGDVPEAAIRFYAKKIRDDLIERGIDKVSFSGLRDRELQVEIPERELRRLDLTVADVSRAVAANSRDLPSGQMEGNVEKQLRALADLGTTDDLGKVEIKSFPSGEKVRIEDIADVRNGFKDGDPRGLSGGVRAVQITVERAETADTLNTHAILNQYLVEIDGKLPPGIELRAYDVRAEALVDRILLLVKNGIGGLVIVVFVLFVFLNARIAFWVAMGIPIALLATVGLMYVTGQTINMVSLFGLIMTLGIIVDDAIVVGEHTATRFAAGDGPYEAAEEGAGRMVTPVIAAMITTAAAFGPILLITGTLGQIIGVLPFVVLAVITASLIECFLVLPGHLAHTLQLRQRRRWSFWRQFFVALIVGSVLISISTAGEGRWLIELTGAAMEMLRAYIAIPSLPVDLSAFSTRIQAVRAENDYPVFLGLIVGISLVVALAAELLFLLWSVVFGGKPGSVAEEGSFRRAFDRGFNWFRDHPFSAFVTLSYNWRYVTISIALACVMIGAIGLIRGEIVRFVFFPTVEAETINARVVFHAGTPENKVEAAVKRIEASLADAERKLTGGEEKLVVASFVTLGSAGRNAGDNLASVRVQLTTSEERIVRTPDIVRTWRQTVPKIAGVKRVALYESRGGPPGRDIDIQLQGDDAATLKKAAAEIIPVVETVNGSSGVADDLPYGKPELVMTLTPRGAALGFSIEDVGRQLRNAFEGAIPRRFADGDDEVTIRISRKIRDKGIAALRNFDLKSPAGDFAPLYEIVDIKERQGFAVIERIDGKATVSVTADLDTKVTSTEEAIKQLEASDIGAIATKYGASYRYSGRDEERREAFADIGTGAMIAGSIIYIVLAWVFASYFRPMAIMLIIPFGIVGAVTGHYLWGSPLTILSFVALLGLSGILVNDSIILVSRLDERLAQGEDLAEAAVGASRDRLRAVLLTSLTTIGGLIPLMFETSLQAKFLLPMAITIVFGLATATLLVLFLVPAFVGIGDDVKRFLSAIYGRTKRDSAALQPAE